MNGEVKKVIKVKSGPCKCCAEEICSLGRHSPAITLLLIILNRIFLGVYDAPAA